MEIDKTVHLLKNSLINLEKNFSYQYISINAGSANAKDCLDNIISELTSKQFFYEKCEDELRKLHLLLLLNTELGIRNELECSSDVGHVVGAIPLLNPYVYFTLCYKFNLIRFLIEIIELGPVRLAVQVLILISSEVKCLPVTSYFMIIADCLSALFLRFLKSEPSGISKNLFDYFQILLLCFKNDNIIQKNFESMKRNGYKWLNLMKLLNSATNNRFTSKAKNLKFIELYDITIHNDPTDEILYNNCLIQKCYEQIFYKCREFGEILDIDMFMAWHEIEYDHEKTLQNTIGEEAFHVRELLEPYKHSNVLPDSASELITMLQSIQKKPIISQINSKKLNIHELQQKILENIDFDLCFINDLKNFFEEEACILDFELSKSLIYRLCSDTAKEEIDKKIIKHVISILLRRMEFEQIVMFVEEFTFKYGLHHVLYEPAVDSILLIEQINSLEFEDQEEHYKMLKDVILLTIRSTYKVFKIFIKCGSSENGCRKNIMKILTTLKPLCLYRINSNFTSGELPLLIVILQDFLLNDFRELSVSERHQFSVLIFSFIQENLINNNLFLIECLLPMFNIGKCISWQTVADLLQILRKFIVNYHTEINFPVLNLFSKLAYILDSATWSISTFSWGKVVVREEIMNIIDLLTRFFSSSLSNENFGKKLKLQLNKFSEFTKFYFHKICTPILQSSPESQLISLIHMPITDRNKFIKNFEDNETVFILRMSEILPLCTLKELEFFIENFVNGEYEYYTFILDFITDAIAFISNCASQFCLLSAVDSTQIFNCLGYVINNFLITLQKCITPHRRTNNKINFVKYVNRCAAILLIFPPHLIDTFKFNLIKFVNEFLENSEMVVNNSKFDFGPSVIENLNEDVHQLIVGLFLI